MHLNHQLSPKIQEMLIIYNYSFSSPGDARMIVGLGGPTGIKGHQLA